MKALKQRNKSKWSCRMVQADALWDKVQNGEGEENLHEILRLETAHIDPKHCPCNCTTDMPKPH